MAAKFNLKEWAEEAKLKKETVDELIAVDFDDMETLMLLNQSDLADLKITKGQRKLLEKATQILQGGKPITTPSLAKDIKEPITTSSLAKDSGLNAILQQLETEGGLDLLINGAIDTKDGKDETDKGTTASARIDNNPQVFLGLGDKKKGMTDKPMLIPDFVQSFGFGQDEFEEHELTNSLQSRVVVRTARAKPKLEKISLATWIGANCRIMHNLIKNGKLSSPSDTQDYLSYTVKISELLESYTLISVLYYDDQYRKLQHEYNFRWGSDSQHLHTRFLKRRERPENGNTRSITPRSYPSTPSKPICKQYNSASGCQWPNCKFSHTCILPGCGKPHSQLHHSTPQTGNIPTHQF